MFPKIPSTAKIVIISGATASGKSMLATKIAGEKNGIIINADAMQIYKELPILSAQPNLELLKQVPHFLYSIFKHNQNSSLNIWLNLAVEKINQALQNKQLPIVVGGTGLYISKLVSGINFVPEIEENLKNHLRQIGQNLNKEELIKMLIDLGDDLLKIQNPNLQSLDKQRLMRRLEVLKQTGKSLSWWQEQPNKTFFPAENFYHINIELKRDQLYQNCNQRLINMFNEGAIKEVRELLKQSPKPDALIAKTIGFVEIKDFLEGKISQKQAIEIASKKTRNYAKRQLTWFRHQFKSQNFNQIIN